MVGSKNVVHLITDNASNYKAVETLLNERYPIICWSPCAAHCINLILKDIGEMGTVKSLVSLASSVTVFVYNHKYVLNWLRKIDGWKEIIRPGETRFVTTFIALKNLHDRKDICDTDERPSLGYVYEEITNGLLDYIESKVDWCIEENLTKEIGMYRERERSFGRKLAILTSKKDRPENWWKLFGCDAPNLQKLAIWVLSQTASFSGCEHNWSVFERIHTKKRNRHNQQKRSYDPVDYESIDKTEFWVVEEEQEGELDYEKLKEELEEPPIHGQCSNFEQLEDDEDEAEDVDLETFQCRNFFNDEDEDWH
ncbi:uncharacterized protein LOC113773468 [Coffea eugenioides]|uniref:uncharacterized protein LOC113773468 n=1 Tax=Coffea eugenioides TaxID=49369 RepID=UPI000F60C45C|nr:uncharacterized protein LOC113773468 [Coffea eugenioides]